MTEYWSACNVIAHEYNGRCGFSALLGDEILRDPGPVLMIKPVQVPARVKLEQQLRGRCVVYCTAVSSISELLDAFDVLRSQHELGEPRLPRKLVVAILIVKKLMVQQMWGGKDKGYMWSRVLPKGRGIPEEFSDVVHEVANYLKNHGVLVPKTSKGQSKYALNSSDRPAIHRIVEHRRFEDLSLMRILERDPRTASARILDERES